MQRRLVPRAEDTDGCTDQQREQPNRCEHEIHRARPHRRRQRHHQRLSCPEPQEEVRKARAFAGPMMEFDDVGWRADRDAVDANQKIALANAGRVAS